MCAGRRAFAWRTPPVSSIGSRRPCARSFRAQQISSVVDNIGLAVSSINVTYSTSGTVGSSDADVLISLKPGHAPTSKYMHILRRELPREFPGATFAFLPADIVSQILNFGIPAPIDIQITGPSPKNRDVANELLESLRHVPGFVDARIGATGRSAGDPGDTRIAAARSSWGSPSATWPTTCCSPCPAAVRSRRPSGSIRKTACSTRWWRRPRSTA